MGQFFRTGHTALVGVRLQLWKSDSNIRFLGNLVGKPHFIGDLSINTLQENAEVECDWMGW
jgi:hypothetical protein